METLMQHKALIAPVLTYLFHRLEARFDGRPTLLILDEAWTFLDDALFAARIREWLKTLRKKNVAVVFATQSLADVERSTIAPALIESCPTRIFLPNDRALEPQTRGVYERFGLNARQVEILSVAAPKRDYYAQTARGNRLFELGLGPIALALCGSSSPDDQRLVDRCVAEHKSKDFAHAFLQAKGLAWAAELLQRWPRPPEMPAPLIPTISTEIDPAEDVPAAAAASPNGSTSSPKAAASADAPRTPAALLPGLPGGPPMSERLSPFRVASGKIKRRGR
jgi:type IV secretion system protein VirB4